MTMQVIKSFIFQSTPSAWRETLVDIDGDIIIEISIHSLRMEGDNWCILVQLCKHISIHSLRMEGDYRIVKI